MVAFISSRPSLREKVHLFPANPAIIAVFPSAELSVAGKFTPSTSSVSSMSLARFRTLSSCPRERKNTKSGGPGIKMKWPDSLPVQEDWLGPKITRGGESAAGGGRLQQPVSLLWLRA